MKILQFGVALAILANVYSYKTYSGYQTLKIPINGQEDADFITSFTDNEHYDIWKEARRPGDEFHVMVDPETNAHFKEALEVYGLQYEIMVADVGVNVVNQMERHAGIKRDLTYDHYWTLVEVNEWIDTMAATYSGLVSIITPGTSFEGRTIRGLKISTGGTDKPAVWVDSCIHSREWIACSTNMYMTQKMLENYGVDTGVTNILDGIDIYMVPVFNVDGFEYTWTNERMWRKTRSLNPQSSCMGTDPNRNWDFFHCERGSSTSPCSDTYCGSGPFSEVEVANVVNYLETIPNLQAYIAIHSYGNWWMSTYAHYATDPPDHAEMMNMCDAIAENIWSVNGEIFECDRISAFVGTTSGSSVDYVKDNLSVKYNFAPELRGNGFIINESNIVPSGEEIYSGMLALYNQILAENA